ncbi:hypothetical protein ACR3FL_002887, partial [Salmonella enterica]
MKDSYYTHSPVYSLYNSAICFCIRTMPPTSGCLSTSSRARGEGQLVKRHPALPLAIIFLSFHGRENVFLQANEIPVNVSTLFYLAHDTTVP